MVYFLPELHALEEEVTSPDPANAMGELDVPEKRNLIMRHFRIALLFVALAAASTLNLAAAQKAFEYALLIIGPDGYTFEAPDAAADGVNADDFYLNLTGEELLGGAPAVAVLSAIGGSGWELVTVDTSEGQTATFYFKRPY